MTGIAETKAAARAAAFARRKLAFAAGQSDAARHLTEALAPFAGSVLSGYMPMRTEIDPLSAMAAHRGLVCVPVITGKGQPLAFREWNPLAEMVPGEFGAQIPADGAWLVPQVLIVPLLAFDRRGYRLGYGGGFYDRTLEGLRANGRVTAIGFAFSMQEVPEVPVEPVDQALDLIVTEAGAFVPGEK
ncbi:MAG: 5-formyltetrahydrofolate cyclo-ligase [Paracoccaceae bacterium]